MSAQTDAVNAALDSVDTHLANAETAAAGAIQAVADAKTRVAALPTTADDLTPIVTRINGQDTRVQALGGQLTQIANDAGTIAPG